MTSPHLLALGDPGSRHFQLLSKLPPGTSWFATQDPAQAAEHAARATAILCDMGRASLLEPVIAQAAQLRVELGLHGRHGEHVLPAQQAD